MAETLSDNNLIKNYLKGDEKSLEILIGRYLKPIYSFIYKNVGNQAEAEDITQEVFVRIWKNIKKFDQKKKFKPWLFQIARNASIDYLRKKKAIPFSRFENEKGQNAFIENIKAAPLYIIENLSDKRVLAAAMQGIGPREQKIINLRHNEGMSFKQIAEVFEESINTIKSRYRRTLVGLKRNIEKVSAPDNRYYS